MENDNGKRVDLYIPRKCSYTNNLIEAKDRASVQISIAKVDSEGIYTGANETFALCGYLRNKSRSDQAMNQLCTEAGFLTKVLDLPPV
eukprot:CAMPEP_0170742356 /NCGR_PEP_ID=MMETSP0437-20130122/6700_1 /TAXON_ID=0 /ORGANISM="Sexangularia sp." /LENGTH=87 /DNA_ID=CAMNT_0011080971 /DNA_START=40 /DNA_END=303 /DNA_ORIENTATION=-